MDENCKLLLYNSQAQTEAGAEAAFKAATARPG
jgi:hypothetical protein